MVDLSLGTGAKAPVTSTIERRAKALLFLLETNPRRRQAAESSAADLPGLRGYKPNHQGHKGSPRYSFGLSLFAGVVLARFLRATDPLYPRSSVGRKFQRLGVLCVLGGSAFPGAGY